MPSKMAMKMKTMGVAKGEDDDDEGAHQSECVSGEEARCSNWCK